MKILHISDTHGFHKQLPHLPEADVIVHSGDFTFAGSENEVLDFGNWFCDLPYKHKIFIAGNHDDCLYGCKVDNLDENCHYLDCGYVVIDGVKFFGIPLFVQNFIGKGFETLVNSIPADTDVLITHGPPFGILDYADKNNMGDKQLLQKVMTVWPKLHLFGHIHDKNGVVEKGGTIFSNACFVDDEYKITNEPYRLLTI